MNTTIPSAEDLSVRLRALRLAELRDLAARSGVPYRTLINIRLAITPNPGIETVRKFLPLLPSPAPQNAQAAQAAEQAGAQ